MQTIEFYQGHLDRVSRSFAICIQKLNPPFRQWVSLSYLLCRVLDTVEDSSWSDRALQEAQYDEFHSFMLRAPTHEKTLAWAKRFSPEVVEGEKLLLLDSFHLFEDLHGLSEDVQHVIQSTVGKMYRGMQFYSQRSTDGSLRLTDLTDTNRYCYFVAGVVGELLSKLFTIYRPDFQAGPEFQTNGLHFGLFLQKVNLLKDQRSDELEGRYLVPNRPQLLASLRENASGAFNYLLSLPQDERGYRTFCAWSLFLGAASLPWMEQAFQSQNESKIPRSVTQELLKAIESIVQDNAALSEGFEQYLTHLPNTQPSPLPASPQTHARTDDAAWLIDLTQGTLGISEMNQLRMM